MKKIQALVLAVASLASLSGCSYGAIATTQDNKVVITRQDQFLAGMLRKVFVCQVSDGGVTGCGSIEKP